MTLWQASRPGLVLMLLALHLVAAVASPWLARRLGARALLVVGAAPAAVLLWAATAAVGILEGQPVSERLAWAPSLGFEVAVRVDAFSLLMVLLVSGIGVLVFAYGAAYFHQRQDLGRLTGLLVGFSGAMLGLVVADNLLALFLFWELTSITSYLLIGIEDGSAASRSAALRALLTTGAGGLAMFGGFVLLAQEAGTWSLSIMLAAPPSGTLVEVALILVLLGAFTKSAQAPFHFWLPGAMAAPTPVSAYLHSATMVKAGVYLIARFAPAFADVAFWRPLVLTVGLATMLLGGWRALAQVDLKLLLAYGTVSQLGFMVVLLGAGFEAATLAGTAVLLAHAVFKATLFMVVGIVEHQAGTRDLRRLNGLHRSMRATAAVAAVAGASMVGLPPLLGFVAKEAAYGAFGHGELGAGGGLVLAGLVIGSALTVAYSVRVVWGAFGDKGGDDLGTDVAGVPIPGPPARFLAPAALLSVLSVLFGLVPAVVDDVVVGAARALDQLVEDGELALWHGVNEALVLSAVALVTGAGLWVARRPITWLQRRGHVLPPAAEVFDRVVELTLRTAGAATGRVQSGSLPVYLSIILTTVLLVPGVLLLRDLGLPNNLVTVDRPVQLPVAALMAVATVGAVKTMHRLGAVIAVGAVGYGVAILFVVQGAPDLALTQLLIETLLLVVFVLVLRHLPRRFSRGQTAVPKAWRIVLSLLVGAFFAGFTLLAFAGRPDLPPVSEQYVARALPDAGGRNVVNTILVDFRAFDTLGEIVVLTVAALGVMGLVRAARRERIRTRTSLRRHPFRPSPILDAAVHSLFRTVLLFSIVLLLIGHDHPGGGFIGGLVAGGAFMLVYLAGGDPALRRTQPLAPEVFLGVGVGVAALTGVAGWVIGDDFLAGGSWSLDTGPFGIVKLTTALVFDVGVYLVVVGLVLALLRSLGREEVQAL